MHRSRTRASPYQCALSATQQRGQLAGGARAVVALIASGSRRPARSHSITLERAPCMDAVRAFSASTATDAGQPSTSTSLLSELADNMPSASGRPDAVFQNAKAALLSAAEEVLSEEQSRSQPAWFTLGEPRLMRCIRARQSAESLWHHAAGPAKVAAAKAYAAARRAVAREVRRCKRQWLQVQFEGIKPGATPA